MRTAAARRLGTASGWVRAQGVLLVRKRRAQLVAAVMFGALLGGGFVAASTGLSEGGPGHSVFDQAHGDRGHQGPQGHSGYDNTGE